MMQDKKDKPQYYECGQCGHYHSVSFYGDCRQDDARFTWEDLERKHGECEEGWEEVPMPGCDKLVSEL